MLLRLSSGIFVCALISKLGGVNALPFSIKESVSDLSNDVEIMDLVESIIDPLGLGSALNIISSNNDNDRLGDVYQLADEEEDDVSDKYEKAIKKIKQISKAEAERKKNERLNMLERKELAMKKERFLRKLIQLKKANAKLAKNAVSIVTVPIIATPAPAPAPTPTPAQAITKKTKVVYKRVPCKGGDSLGTDGKIRKCYKVVNSESNVNGTSANPGVPSGQSVGDSQAPSQNLSQGLGQVGAQDSGAQPTITPDLTILPATTPDVTVLPVSSTMEMVQNNVLSTPIQIADSAPSQVIPNIVNTQAVNPVSTAPSPTEEFLTRQVEHTVADTPSESTRAIPQVQNPADTANYQPNAVRNDKLEDYGHFNSGDSFADNRQNGILDSKDSELLKAENNVNGLGEEQIINQNNPNEQKAIPSAAMSQYMVNKGKGIQYRRMGGRHPQQNTTPASAQGAASQIVSTSSSAPTPAQAPAPAQVPATSSQIPAAPAQANNVTGSSTDTFSGEGTYYDPGVGLGSCGVLHQQTEMVAAINGFQYGTEPNPNNAAVCKKCALVNYKNPAGEDKSVKVSIQDKCPPCKFGDLDLSTEAFKVLSPLDVGRIKITWKFVDC
ncbi:Papain inhibitor [Smittium mucronatum]|uniref:Papain inhibitor n=1 Tax=Smittium mucronatum TaxID=133383 RepID=A0A1R0GYE3_9FUNG|nr:Papain inhibitor [Smittium mucronatum]